MGLLILKTAFRYADWRLKLTGNENCERARISHGYNFTRMTVNVFTVATVIAATASFFSSSHYIFGIVAEFYIARHLSIKAEDWLLLEITNSRQRQERESRLKEYFGISSQSWQSVYRIGCLTLWRNPLPSEVYLQRRDDALLNDEGPSSSTEEEERRDYRVLGSPSPAQERRDDMVDEELGITGAGSSV